MLKRNIEVEKNPVAREQLANDRKTLNRLFLTIAAAALLCSVMPVPLKAELITYTMISTGTGTLGGSSFTDTFVTLTLVGDTSTVTSASPGLFNPGTATVNVAGLGTATLTDTIGIFATFHDLSLFGTPAVVIGDLSNPSDPSSFTGILGQVGPEFFGYDLQSPFGPDSGSGGPFSGSHMTPHFPTTVGDLTWAVGQPLGTSAFTAVVTTPEPASLSLIGTVFLTLVASQFWRRRLTRRTH
jgi:hypothetical protein